MPITGATGQSARQMAIANWTRKISIVGGSLRDVQILAGHSAFTTIPQYIETDAGAMRLVVES